MKYPQLVSTPAVVKEWLEAELECLGIDSAAYARTILSLLSRDTIDPAEVIQSGYVLVANKGGRGGAGGLGGPHPPRTREEELKRAEVVECLRSASEDHGGIQLLVDQLISMLKQLPAASEPSADTARAHTDSSSRRRPAAGDAQQTQSQSDDPVLRYEAAFPALRRESPGVIPLTYFSKMTRSAAPAGGGLWRADLPPSAAAWPTTLDQLRLLLPPPSHPEEHTAPLEPAGCGAPAHAPPPPPPKPPEPPVTAETTRVIRPSAETHFQPIRRCSGSDGAEEPAAPPATYDARLYLRSDSGGLYLEDEPAAAGGRSAAEPPQKYMMFRERNTLALHRGLTPKFKLSCNEKYCQTDGDGPEVGAGVGRDLLQLLVSEEQADEAARGGMASDGEDEDDPSSEVLSSLQQTLHSIYEDGSDAADSGAEPEAADTLPLPAERWRGVLAVPRRPSAFARVRRRSPAHRPLYLRGGGADSLLAAVYVGGDWSPAELPAVSQPSDHRPLYARQPPAAASTTNTTTCTAPAEFAEHRQLSSGRISDTVYCQRPTEYPALRYQLAGRDRPEVTFCRLGGDTHSAKYVLLKDDSVASAAWDTISDAARSSREASVASDGAADATLWQAACEHEPCDRSADGALWEARAHAGLLGRRRSSPDSAIWEQEPAGAVWEAPSSLVEPEEGCQLGALWEGTCGRPETDISGGGGAETAGHLWETPRDLAGTELTPEHTTSISGIRHHHAPDNNNMGGVRHHPALEHALELAPDLATSIGGARHHHTLEQAPENTTLGGVCHHLVPEHGTDHATLGGRRRSCADRDSSVEMTIWEPLEDQAERIDTAHGNIWESATAPSSQHVSLDALWPVRELGQREMSVEDPRWELEEPVPPRDQSAAEEDARWHVPRRQERACSSERDLWASQAELAQRDTSVEKTIWESGEEPAPRSDTSAERALWEPSGVHAPPPAPWSVPDGLPPGESALWPADAPLWEGSEEPPGWPGWEDDTPIRAPDHIWRRAEPPTTTSEWSSGEVLPAVTSDGDSSSEQVRRLLWRLGGDDVLSQTGQYPADAASDAGRSWEFIDEHNVKNKIEAQVVSDGGPLASELADGEGEGGGGWRVLPALRQLSERLGLTDGAPPLPDGVALNAWALEEQWRRDDGPQRPTLDRRVRRSDRKRPCSYFMEGNCKRNDCKFSHDLSAITCVFWEESGCFKGVHCPFLHGYPADDDDGEDSSDSAKRAVPKKSFKLEKEDFPSLHNMKKWHRNEDDDNRKAGRRSCRRHKSFSEATLGVGSGDPEPPRPAIGGRGKRRRHHSKSEGVRPSDTGARRP